MFFSEKSLVKSKKRKNGGLSRVRAEREKREAARLKRQKEEAEKRLRERSSIAIQREYRAYRSNAELCRSMKARLDAVVEETLRTVHGVGFRGCSTEQVSNIFSLLFYWRRLASSHSSTADISDDMLENLSKIIVHSSFCADVASLSAAGGEASRRPAIAAPSKAKEQLRFMLGLCPRYFLSRQWENVEIGRTSPVMELMTSCTYDLPVTTHRLVARDNAAFLVSKGLFQGLDGLQRANAGTRLSLSPLLSGFAKIGRIALNAESKDVLESFVAHVVSKEYYPTLLNDPNLSHFRISNSDEAGILQAVPSLAPRLSPEQATTLLHFVLVERAFPSLAEETHLFADVVGALFTRVKVNLFYGERHSMPTLYRSKSSDSLNDSFNQSSDDEDQLGDDEDWGQEVGDDSRIVQRISSRMRQLAGSPRRCSEVVKETFDPLTIVDSVLSSFDALVLQGGDLTGCIPLGTFLARWGSPDLLFQEGGKGNESAGLRKFNIPETGAPLRNLETAFPSLDPSVIGLVYVQCNRDVQKAAKALHTMSGSSDSAEASGEIPRSSTYSKNALVNSVSQFLLQPPPKAPACVEKEALDLECPRYAVMWKFLKKNYDVTSLAGNQEIADTVSGASEAFLVFVTGLYLQLRGQDEEEFFTLQKPFKLLQLSEIVLWLQSLMARLGEKERHTRFQGKHQNIVELVLQLACLRLFTHLHSRHKTRSWIRNTSSIDSDVLAALDLDRRLMREQDEAFTEALMADQKKGSASSAENDLGEAQTEEAEERKEAVQPEPAKTMTREEIRAARLAALEKRLNK